MHHDNPLSVLATDPTSRGSIPAGNGDLTGSLKVPDPLVVDNLTVNVLATIEDILVVGVSATGSIASNTFLPHSGLDVALFGNYIPGTDSTYTLGEVGTEWLKVHTDTLHATTVITSILDNGGTEIIVTEHLRPNGSTETIGTAAKPWETSYSTNSVVDDIFVNYLNGNDFAEVRFKSSLRPDSTEEVGVSAQPFASGYINSLHANTLVVNGSSPQIGAGGAGRWNVIYGTTVDTTILKNSATSNVQLASNLTLDTSGRALGTVGTPLNALHVNTVDVYTKLNINSGVKFTNTSGTANAGGATLPANPTGFLTVDVGAGTNFKVPYYAT